MDEKLFAPVLNWLDNEPEGFSMEFFKSTGVRDYKGHPCGTAMCIAGALVAFNPHLREEMGQFTSFELLGKAVGMDKKQTCNLFFASDETREGNLLPEGQLFEHVTPKQAAHAIRSMLTTGRVQW